MRSDLTGQVFARLTVLGYSGLDSEGRNSIWLCRCSCGKVVDVRADHLRSGRMKSCGCLRREISSQVHTTHGHARPGRRDPAYKAWADMIQRCTNPRDAQWPNYGGRGITVCQRWRDSFESFLADVGPRPLGRVGGRAGFSIDRINNDGGYEPGNVRWATPKEQRANQRVG